MKLDSLKPVKGSTKNRKRIGRGHGSGLGKSAGRGDKGAGQRSGSKEDHGLKVGKCQLLVGYQCGVYKYFQKEFQIVNIDKNFIIRT